MLEMHFVVQLALNRMIEDGLRGGVTECTYRKKEASDTYNNEVYDSTQPSCYISCLDVSNLYGLTMCKQLPCGISLPWTKRKIVNYSAGDDIGSSLDTNLEYPKATHDLHRYFPWRLKV